MPHSDSPIPASATRNPARPAAEPVRAAAAAPTYYAGMTPQPGTGPRRVVLTGGPLRVDEVVAVARGRVPVELAEEGRKRMAGAREVV